MPKDNFSHQAKLYAQFRPHYPDSLYQFIYEHTSAFESAWDCATGNGQVASILSQRFKKVYATDISQKQLDNATQKDNIIYSIGSAEHSGLEEKVDLITVAQALHWFNLKAFYKEVERVAKPGGTLAYWLYGLPQVNEQISPLIKHFNDHTIGAYWDAERKIWASRYENINFPLKEKQRKTFSYDTAWSLDHLFGYLTSWSSTQNYINKHHTNPVEPFIEKLKPLWSGEMPVSFPIFFHLGEV